MCDTNRARNDQYIHSLYFIGVCWCVDFFNAGKVCILFYRQYYENSLTFSVLSTFFQVGFAMLCAGCVRKKNVQNTLLKNLLDACGASIAFFSVGYAFAFGNTTSDDDPTSKTFLGTSNFFLVGVEDLSFWFFQYVFSAAAGMLNI